MLKKAQFMVALMLSHQVLAGWWGGEEEKPRRRRRDDYVEEQYEIDDSQGGYNDAQEDYNRKKYRKGARDKRDGKEYDYYDKMTREERRRHMAEERAEMNRVRSRNRDEMMTE